MTAEHSNELDLFRKLEARGDYIKLKAEVEKVNARLKSGSPHWRLIALAGRSALARVRQEQQCKCASSRPPRSREQWQQSTLGPWLDAIDQILIEESANTRLTAEDIRKRLLKSAFPYKRSAQLISYYMRDIRSSPQGKELNLAGIRRQLLAWYWSTRTCFSCGALGKCEHRQADADLPLAARAVVGEGLHETP